MQPPGGAFAGSSAHRFTSNYRTLFDFDHNDGDAPQGDLVAHHGVLYGVAQGGKNSTCARSHQGCGVIFSVRPGGAEKVVYAFGGLTQGAYPTGPLTYYWGSLYGTTQNGGACGGHCGMVYSYSLAKSTLTPLFRFNGSDGKYPSSGLALLDGVLYGTTERGGSGHCAQGCGTVFAIAPFTGALTTLYRFTGGRDGGDPGSLVSLNGTLYGTVSQGGGTACRYGCGGIFSLTRSGTEHMLYSFAGGADGEHPSAIISSGSSGFYGATSGGGADSNGTVFTLTTSGKESVLYSFPDSQSDGNDPNSLTLLNGVLYGTTASGGSDDLGTLFSLTSSGGESVLHDFTGDPDGRYPRGRLTELNGVYYGVTAGGGTFSDKYSGGTIYRYKP